MRVSAEIEKNIKSAFFGGRCELYQRGNYKNLNFFDFKSMYGNIMLTKFPTICKNYKNFNEWGGGCLPQGFIKVLINQNLKFPILPSKNENFFGPRYLNGIFEGVYWWEELKFYTDNGGEVLKYEGYFECDDYQNTYLNATEQLLKMRGGGCFFAKNLINFFYGRLALTKDLNVSTLHINLNEIKLINSDCVNEYVKYKELFLIGGSKIKKKSPSNLIAAAIITSRARIRLNTLILNLIKSNCKIIQLDTDAVFFEGVFENYKSYQKYGDFIKYPEVEFLNAKNYNIICAAAAAPL
jgi:hypothetical protein